MKKLILIALIFVSFRSATNAQQVNISLLQNETVTTEMPVNKIELTKSQNFLAKDQVLANPDPGTMYDKAYYLKKSRNNRIASLCLVGGGFVIAGIGVLTFPKDYDIVFGNSSEDESKADAATALIIVGCAAMLTSIPFTVMAGVNKRKANAMVSIQKTGSGVVPPGIGKQITGITMTFPIGK